MRPYYDQDGITIFHGDCREVLPTLEPGSVDLVLTDPPYGMNNDCDYTRFTMGPNGHGFPSMRKYAPVVGDDRPFDPTPFLDYPRVILWGWNHFGAMLPAGTTLVWIKRFEGGFGSFLSDGEVAWMKGGCGVYLHRDTSLYGETRQRRHPTEKPVGLMKWCIEKVGGTGLILDPFMGSGTTLRAAKDLGRRARNYSMRVTRKQAHDMGIALPEQPWCDKKKRGQPSRDGNQGRDKLFDAACLAHSLPLPVHEYRFAPPRRWKFDYLWDWLALEVQGGLFTGGRHVRGAALLREHEKLNEAVMLGYSVLFCTPADVESGAIFAVVKRALESREEQS